MTGVHDARLTSLPLTGEFGYYFASLVEELEGGFAVGLDGKLDADFAVGIVEVEADGSIGRATQD